MTRLISLFLISLFTLAICTRTSSMPTSDEEMLKNLELEAAKHSGFSDADVAFQKSILGPRVISVDPLGHLYDQSAADYEKMVMGLRTANPDAKANTDVHDVKVRISGDTATVTFVGTYNSSGFKVPNANVPGAHFCCG